MTHFTVLVRVDGAWNGDIEEVVSKVLAPYDENAEVAPYRDYAGTRDIVTYIKSASRGYTGDGKTYQATLDKRWTTEEPVGPSRDDFEQDEQGRIIDAAAWNAAWDAYKAASAAWNAEVIALYDQAEVAAAYNAYWGKDGEHLEVDDKGIYTMSTYNPKSRWDWWQVGGRWRGYFVAKEGTPVPGKPGIGEGWDVLEPGEWALGNPKIETAVATRTAELITQRRTDVIRRSDIDWGAMLDVHIMEMGEWYDQCAFSDRILSWETGEKPSDITRKAYLDRAKTDYSPATSAICDETGWIQPDRTGWWGIRYNETMTKDEWDKVWSDYVANGAADDWLVVVDCHI